MRRKTGRPHRDRLRAMRFALLAQHMPPAALTSRQISGLLDIHVSTAARWRRDVLDALSPIEIDGIPAFLTPNTPVKDPK